MRIFFILFIIFIYSNALADKKQVEGKPIQQGKNEISKPATKDPLDQEAVIGKISVSANHATFLIDQRGDTIREHQKLITTKGQVLKILMDDETELLLGPNSEFTFINWTKRSKDGYLIRSLQLIDGILWAHVRRIYSQEEPFLVETPEAVVAVRGTEFVVQSVGHHKPTDKSTVNIHPEVDVHTLQGEVFFAKTKEALKVFKNRVIIDAGRASLVQPEMPSPQIPHLFDLVLFQKYFDHFVPGTTLVIHHQMTPEKRAHFAIQTGIEPFSGRSIAFEGMKVKRSNPKPHKLRLERAKEE